jgi:REP element-mobilizing transposase RayT
MPSPETSERFRRRDLPHWDLQGATYFVTNCLAGSIPALGRLPIKAETARSQTQPRSGNSRHTSSASTDFVARERLLDAAIGVRWLENPNVAAAVRESMLYFAGTRYDLLGYVIMPNHVHWVFSPLATWTEHAGSRPVREIILHSFCRQTARICNRILGRTGRFWQHESYDRAVRDEAELQRIIDYIERNPVKAGLCDRPEQWEFSSAWRGGSGEDGMTGGRGVEG